jgi:uncharacterized cupredoxin-like copper-binding protein
VLLVSMAACGDDDTTTTASPTTTSASSEFTEYCEASLAIETAPEPDIDFDALTPEQAADAAKKFAADLKPLADRVEATAPAEIEADIATQVKTLDATIATGDFSGFEGPDFEAAEAKVHAFDLENCGWAQSEVTMGDYSFQGLEDTYSAGPVSFDVTNEGKELHEFILLRKNDGVTETFDQLLELPEDQAEQKTTAVGSAFAEPGGSDYAVVDLEPGEYLAICFIPVGLTPEAAQAAEAGGPEPSGPPHFTEGMQAEFTVE